MTDKEILNRLLSHKQWFVTNDLIRVVSNLVASHADEKLMREHFSHNVHAAELKLSEVQHEREQLQKQLVYALDCSNRYQSALIDCNDKLTAAKNKVASLEKELEDAMVSNAINSETYDRNVSFVEQERDIACRTLDKIVVLASNLGLN